MIAKIEYFHNRGLKLLRWNKLLDKRGQIRGIDFAVAAFFFVIVLGQLIVVILNANILIVSQREDVTTREELQHLASLLFGSEGYPKDWGYIDSQQPESFGLAVQQLATTGYELDPTKMARLILGSSNITGYSDFFLSYDNLHSLLGLKAEINFHLTIKNPLSISLEPGDHSLSATVNFLDVNQIADVNLTLFTVDLSNGIIYPLTTSLTDSNGEAILDYNSFGDLSFPHTLIVVAQRDNFWGYTHYIPPTEDFNQFINIDVSNRPLLLTQEESFSGNCLGVSDYREESDNHTFSVIHTTAIRTLTYRNPGTNNFTTSPVLPISFVGNANDLVLVIVSVSEGSDSFSYRIGTIPALFDKNGANSGTFATIGPEIPTEAKYEIETGLFSISARNMLLIADLTIWEED